MTTPNFPGTYPSDSDCTLVINGGDNFKFKLKFNFFEVEEDEDGKSYQEFTFCPTNF